ncbi:heat shock factor binding protein 1-domain-containing protein, partial [Vararia minispora EC-137]
LKVTPANTPAKIGIKKDAPSESKLAEAPKSGVTNPADISSPHELTAYVETLLENLDAKFDEMSSQILDRMMQMSSRVDALEASLQDIINSDGTGASVPPSP